MADELDWNSEISPEEAHYLLRHALRKAPLPKHSLSAEWSMRAGLVRFCSVSVDPDKAFHPALWGCLNQAKIASLIWLVHCIFSRRFERLGLPPTAENFWRHARAIVAWHLGYGETFDACVDLVNETQEEEARKVVSLDWWKATHPVDPSEDDDEQPD